MALKLTVTPSTNYIEDSINIKITGGTIPSNCQLYVLGMFSDYGVNLFIKENSLTSNFNFTCPEQTQTSPSGISYGLPFLYVETPNTSKITVLFQLIQNNQAIANFEKTMYIKPEPPTFDVEPQYVDSNNSAITLTNNNKILVNNLSTPTISNVQGTAYKEGFIRYVKIGNLSYNYALGVYTIGPIDYPSLELSITLIDSRGWESEKKILADASKFRYKYYPITISNSKIERNGIGETVNLSASGYYLEGYQLGQNPLSNNYSWKATDENITHTGETTLTIVKTPTTAWTNFNSVIDEYETPNYSTDSDDKQYYTGTEWNNGISSLFSSAIVYNNKYTQEYLQADYDSVNDRYYCLSGGYNGSWHDFWLDTIKEIYKTMYGDDGYGGNYEWNIQETAIKGDIASGFSLDKSFNVIYSIWDNLMQLVNFKSYYIDTALPAIDVYKNNVAIHGLYDEILGGTQIEGDLLADFVTEIDNDGTWYWRKWHSGWVELYAYNQYSGLTLTSSSAGTYYGTAQVIDLPFRLTEFFYAGVQEVSTRSSGVYVYDISLTTNNTKLSTQFRAHGSTSNGLCGVKFYITGKYK